MGIKSKIFGFVAAAALTLSMSAGVAADVGGTVELQESDCSFTLNAGSFDFGLWKWNGPLGKYENVTSAAGVSSLTGTMYYPGPTGGTCKIKLTTTGLSNTKNGVTSTIGATNFGVGSTFSGPFAPLPLDVSLTGATPSTNRTFFLKLESVPSTYHTGTYAGDFQITVSNPALP